MLTESMQQNVQAHLHAWYRHEGFALYALWSIENMGRPVSLSFASFMAHFGTNKFYSFLETHEKNKCCESKD